MIGTVAVTDFGWYEFLAPRNLAEVNFWTPSDRHPFAAPQLSPFLFKLKAPHRAIVGFGYFAGWSKLPDWLAWESFGEGNGCVSLDEMRHRIGRIRQRIRYVTPTGVANIGCILIAQPTFFQRSDWVRQPADWRDRTVSAKSYDLTRGDGKRVWEDVQYAAARVLHSTSPALPLVAESTTRYGTPYEVTPRVGQGIFRIAVTDAYGRACAATGEHSLPALEAAHIQAYSAGGPHEVRNGLLLRADLHRLFDTGYVTVTPDHHLEISARLRADYLNGRTYYPLHGALLQLPGRADDWPAAEFLRWHNEHVYRG